MQSQQVNRHGLHTSATLAKLPAIILAGLFSIHCKRLVVCLQVIHIFVFGCLLLVCPRFYLLVPLLESRDHILAQD
jgi:hypothetical protein